MNLSFFQLSKIFWLIFSPGNFIVILLIATCLLLWLKAHKKAIRLLNTLAVITLIIAIFPVGDWLYYPLEKRFLPLKEISEPIDGIIMLGGSEEIFRTIAWNQVELNDSAERYLAFIHLIKAYPNAQRVYVGGSGSLMRQDLKGRRVAEKLFKSQGLDTTRIIFEPDSKNTYENAIFSKRLINPSPNEKWILVTSASHMPRSYGVFSKAGWKVIPYPVDHHSNRTSLLRLTFNFAGNLDKLSWALREWTGLFAYYLTDKTNCFLPGYNK